MARDLSPIMKRARREGVALHPKAIKRLAKRSYGPGQHGASSGRKPSDYALQLREKQKMKRIYGILEKQFRRYVEEAERSRGVAGEMLLSLLEQRLDNVVYRLGLASSRQGARQIATHGHILVNGRRVDIPSLRVRMGDTIQVRPASQKSAYFKELSTAIAEAHRPSWIKYDPKTMTAQIVGRPDRAEMEAGIDEHLIIEFYSR